MFSSIALQPWVSTGNIVTWVLILGVALIWFIRGMPDRALRKNEGDASLRTALMDRVSKLEADAVNDRDKHAQERREDRDTCDREMSILRNLIHDQERMIDSLQRQIIMFQVASGRLIPAENVSPEMERVMENLDLAFRPAQLSKTEVLRVAEKANEVANQASHATELTVEKIKQDEATNG